MDDHSYTSGDEVKCPFCGAEQSDVWEIGAYEEGDHETTCGTCDSEFTFSTHASYSYCATTPNYDEVQRRALAAFVDGGLTAYEKVMTDAGLRPHA
jgi:transposase-like protein